MTREGSERRDKGKEVARPKKRQRQTPKYVLRVPATLPITVYLSSSSVGPSPTPVVHPPPTPIVHPPPTPVVHPLPTPAANILPPPVIVTLTPPPVIITPIAPPDPTSIPSSSFIPSSETATPSADLDLAGMPAMQGRALTGWASTFGTLYMLIGIQQSFSEF
ncbi:extensin [Vigna angularis]|uniref:extensin n=1 Tax=Phaseolus angularis TaxID=3914 RepID=UPI000809E351|nr:extensin [Vigna angularis]